MGCTSGSPLLLARWQMMLLRQRMAFLVDNLQYYLQAMPRNSRLYEVFLMGTILLYRPRIDR